MKFKKSLKRVLSKGNKLNIKKSVKKKKKKKIKIKDMYLDFKYYCVTGEEEVIYFYKHKYWIFNILI